MIALLDPADRFAAPPSLEETLHHAEMLLRAELYAAFALRGTSADIDDRIRSLMCRMLDAARARYNLEEPGGA